MTTPRPVSHEPWCRKTVGWDDAGSGPECNCRPVSQPAERDRLREAIRLALNSQGIEPRKAERVIERVFTLLPDGDGYNMWTDVLTPGVRLSGDDEGLRAALDGLAALGHIPTGEGDLCLHRWRNRTTRAVHCRFLAGWRAAAVEADSYIQGWRDCWVRLSGDDEGLRALLKQASDALLDAPLADRIALKERIDDALTPPATGEPSDD